MFTEHASRVFEQMSYYILQDIYGRKQHQAYNLKKEFCPQDCYQRYNPCNAGNTRSKFEGIGPENELPSTLEHVERTGLARAKGQNQPKSSSNAAKAARASCGSHEPGQAQGRKSTGLEPEFRFKIIPTAPPVVLHETPLHESPSTDSPLDSPMETESPLPRPPRPIGRKAAKAKRGATSNIDCVQIFEQIVKNNSLRLERDLRRDEADKARLEAFAIEKQHANEKDDDEREMKIMAMDTSHMSPETKAYWKHKRRDVMRIKLFHDDGSSNTDWLNDENN
ncbi:hypothetical protein L3X38_022562 [Prunus dulcis]|uniref:No apical meristem-associated C-terminal domain-containing protein n=1 Tax=Prunus dulcis TaxID=3755 RepID=A0AAD4VWC5_PRUDU|nr:hypothetical protein L3X38_022562 [Prunus dulcis]